MFRSIFLVILFSLLVGCTNPQGARRLLSNQGYTNIQITGYKFFACGEGDWYATGFRATNPVGKIVTGCVCEGVFKNSTIRFDLQ